MHEMGVCVTNSPTPRRSVKKGVCEGCRVSIERAIDPSRGGGMTKKKSRGRFTGWKPPFFWKVPFPPPVKRYRGGLAGLGPPSGASRPTSKIVLISLHPLPVLSFSDFFSASHFYRTVVVCLSGTPGLNPSTLPPSFSFTFFRKSNFPFPSSSFLFRPGERENKRAFLRCLASISSFPIGCPYPENNPFSPPGRGR